MSCDTSTGVHIQTEGFKCLASVLTAQWPASNQTIFKDGYSYCPSAPFILSLFIYFMYYDECGILVYLWYLEKIIKTINKKRWWHLT